MFISPTFCVATIDEKIIVKIGLGYEVGRKMIINKNEKEWPKAIMMNYPLLCLIQFWIFVILYAMLLLMKGKHKENFHSIQFASEV